MPSGAHRSRHRLFTIAYDLPGRSATRCLFRLPAAHQGNSYGPESPRGSRPDRVSREPFVSPLAPSAHARLNRGPGVAPIGRLVELRAGRPESVSAVNEAEARRP